MVHEVQDAGALVDPVLSHKLLVGIKRLGVKEVLALARRGIVLNAKFNLDELGKDRGNVVDLAVLNKRYDLALRLLRLAEETPEAAPPPEAPAADDDGLGDDFGDEGTAAAAAVHQGVESPEPHTETPTPDGTAAESPLPPEPPPDAEVEAEVPEYSDIAKQLAPTCTRALAWAARDGKVELLEELLRCGAPALQSDASGRSALQLAAARGKAPCVLVLLAAGAWGEEKEQAQVQQWLVHLKLGPALGDVAADVLPPPSGAALARAAAAEAAAERALAAEAQANATAAEAEAEREKAALQTRLQFAVMRQGVAEVKALVQKGAPLSAAYDLDEVGRETGTLLELALQHKRYELAQQLLSIREGAGEELARTSRRAVAWAARDGRLQLLEALLRLGAQPAEQDEMGQTPLYLSAMRGQVACVRMLLEVGALEVEPFRDEVQSYLEKWHILEPRPA